MVIALGLAEGRCARIIPLLNPSKPKAPRRIAPKPRPIRRVSKSLSQFSLDHSLDHMVVDDAVLGSSAIHKALGASLVDHTGSSA